MIRRPSKTRLAVGVTAYLTASLAVVLTLLWVPKSVDYWVTFGLASVALVADVVFVVGYHVGTKGFWRKSDIGVHLMTFSGTNVIILSYVVLAMLGLIPMAALPYLGALTYLTLGWIAGWRTSIMRGYIHGGGDAPPRA